MVTYVITVLDNDHLEVITMDDVLHYAGKFNDDILAAIESVLDIRSEEKEINSVS
jgi:hypothetical protein